MSNSDWKATSTWDEDLIIIPDLSEKDDESVDLSSFNKDALSWENVISFSDDLFNVEESNQKPIVSEEKVENEIETKPEENLDFLGNFNTLEDNKKVEEVIQEIHDENNIDENLVDSSTWFSNIDLNLMLDWFILKSKEKIDLINWSKWKYSSKVADLEEQLKKIQEEILLYKSKLSSWDDEIKKLLKIIESLEKQKSV